MGVSSMTGFARAEGEADGISWIWELKSVNGRSLELRLRLPPGFEPIEPQLRAAVSQRCRRGNLADQRGALAGLVEAASGCAAAQPTAIRARLEALLAELSGLAPAIPEERVAQELAMLVSRSDVREELDRLRAHIAQVGDLFERGEAIGRQLDFLCQELNREANTLCSKSADIELTRIGLPLKAVIEQFREQVQNLE